MVIERGSARRAAECQLGQMRKRGLEVTQAMVELRDVARELLPERERRRILEVRAADLDDVIEGFRLRIARRAKLPQRGDEARADRDYRRDRHRGRKDGVWRLALVTVLLW